jgi:hypothetical protein
VSGQQPVLTARFWRTRRSAAVAGILFGILLLAALVMMRVALDDSGLEALPSDAHRRSQIRLSLHLIPFAGIAFLWFIGVVREQLGAVEDRLFATVFLGSGLLFLASLFAGAAVMSSLLAMFEVQHINPDLWRYGQDNVEGLFAVYAMRMAAVFTIAVSTASLRASALPRWVSYVGYVVALALLFAPGEQRWIQMLFPAWVLLVSAVILLTPPAHPAPDADTPAP